MRSEPYFTSVAANVTAGLILAALAACGLPLGLSVAKGLSDKLTAAPETVVQPARPVIFEPPPTPEPPPPVPTLPPRPPATEAFTRVPKTCVDTRGNEGAFDVVLFSRAYSWVQGDTSSVELNDTPADFRQLLRTSALAGYLQEAPEIIALGTASCEGFPEHRNREVRRARNRANKLVGWIEAVRRPRPDWEHWKPVKPLVLGVYNHACRPDEESWPQRRVVLIAIRQRDERLAVYDCLRKALEEDDELSYLATSYTPGFPRPRDLPGSP